MSFHSNLNTTYICYLWACELVCQLLFINFFLEFREILKHTTQGDSILQFSSKVWSMKVSKDKFEYESLNFKVCLFKFWDISHSGSQCRPRKQLCLGSGGTHGMRPTYSILFSFYFPFFILMFRLWNILYLTYWSVCSIWHKLLLSAFGYGLLSS